MNRETTLHIKLDPEMDAQLERLAQSRRKSKGQLAREAIAACYQIAMTELPLQQSRALAAYQGGYISLGKLRPSNGPTCSGLEDLARRKRHHPAEHL